MRMPIDYLNDEQLSELGALIPAPAMDAIVRGMIRFAKDYKECVEVDVNEQLQSRLETTKLEQQNDKG